MRPFRCGFTETRALLGVGLRAPGRAAGGRMTRGFLACGARPAPKAHTCLRSRSLRRPKPLSCAPGPPHGPGPGPGSPWPGVSPRRPPSRGSFSRAAPFVRDSKRRRRLSATFAPSTLQTRYGPRSAHSNRTPAEQTLPAARTHPPRKFVLAWLPSPASRPAAPARLLPSHSGRRGR